MPDRTDDVRARAAAVCEALVKGDVERVIGELSEELKRNLGEVMGLLPLPAVEAVVETVERTATGAYVAVLAIIGESDRTEVQTRWKDRNGEPKIVEMSHLGRTELDEAIAAGEDGSSS